MKNIKQLILIGSMAFANIMPPELTQTNLFYKGDPDVFRLRDACGNEVNVELDKDHSSGITRLARNNLPTIHVYVSKNHKEFRNRILKNKPVHKPAVSLASSELIALTKTIMSGSKRLKKYKDIKLQDVVEILSCVDQAIKIKSRQTDFDLNNQIKVDALLDSIGIDKVKDDLFADSESSSGSRNESSSKNRHGKPGYLTD
uniref:Uncharacterized protein n=1 Tax=Melanthalia intermedia TaxID=172989 RepID=A0A345UB17_9FLOR|nr:hypothetical protein [Melanthalia intermedia]AXI97653.1 hypothetical protein [Melanthalia intermedia]